MKMDRNRKGVCITKNPIVTAADLHSVSNPIEIDNDFFFDIKLTERGFSKLEQVYPITALIVFRVHDQVVFLMDTKKDQLAGTIRVHIVGRKDVLESHDLLSKEIDRAKNQ